MKDINLLMEEEKGGQPEIQKKAVGKTIQVAFLGILIAAFVGVTLVLPGAYLKLLDFKLEGVKTELQSKKYTEIKVLNSEVASVKTIIGEKKNILESIDRQGHPVNEILHSLRNSIPQDCSINGLEYDPESLKVSVRAGDTVQLAEFLLNMGRLDYLSLSDSSASLRISDTGVYTFVFDVLGKGGR